MRIEKVETFIVSSFLIAKITTDDGTEGFGESCYWAFPRATQETIRSFESDLVGMDPANTEHIWNYLYRKQSFRGNGLAGAISAIDIALWDIKGKRLQAPVWDLLGGRARDRVRAISLDMTGETPEELAASARTILHNGFTALKFTPMRGEWWLDRYPNFIRTCLAQVEAVRETVGWDFDIAIEIHRNMLPSEAVVFIQECAKYLPYFVEDPIAPDSVLAMADVARQINVPLAAGERNTGIWEFREYAELSRCHFLKPDVGMAGGISQLRKIAAVAEAQHIRIAPHNFLSPIATAACVQLGVATPNWDVTESYQETDPPRRAVVKQPVPIVDGYFIPPDVPGIGVEFDERSVDRYPYEPMGDPPPMRDDGSIALR